MTDNYILTYQVFNDKNQVGDLTNLLIAHNIEYLFEDASVSFDPSFANNNKEFRIKLKKEDFEKADKILLEISATQIDSVGQDYYLFDFSNQELLEVVTKSD